MTAGFEDRASDRIRFGQTDLLPPAPARALGIGCGEGRVARDLASPLFLFWRAAKRESRA